MTDKLDSAEAELLACNPRFMPTMAEFRNKHNLSLEELGAIVSRNQQIKVRMEVEQPQQARPLPGPAEKWEDCLDKINQADLKGIFRRKMSALISLVVSELGEHMNAAGVPAMRLSGPVDLCVVPAAEWPEFYFTVEVRKERDTYKYEIQGEWQVETP